MIGIGDFFLVVTSLLKKLHILWLLGLTNSHYSASSELAHVFLRVLVVDFAPFFTVRNPEIKSQFNADCLEKGEYVSNSPFDLWISYSKEWRKIYY
jgi:hypothetical protein